MGGSSRMCSMRPVLHFGQRIVLECGGSLRFGIPVSLSYRPIPSSPGESEWTRILMPKGYGRNFSRLNNQSTGNRRTPNQTNGFVPFFNVETQPVCIPNPLISLIGTRCGEYSCDADIEHHKSPIAQATAHGQDPGGIPERSRWWRVTEPPELIRS